MKSIVGYLCDRRVLTFRSQLFVSALREVQPAQMPLTVLRSKTGSCPLSWYITEYQPVDEIKLIMRLLGRVTVFLQRRMLECRE